MAYPGSRKGEGNHGREGWSDRGSVHSTPRHTSFPFPNSSASWHHTSTGAGPPALKSHVMTIAARAAAAAVIAAACGTKFRADGQLRRSRARSVQLRDAGATALATVGSSNMNDCTPRSQLLPALPTEATSRVLGATWASRTWTTCGSSHCLNRGRQV